MISIFDRNAELIAWLSNDGKHLFDADMNWVAYASGGHLWSAETGNWLGPLQGTTLLDQSGRPVGWHPGDGVGSSGRPARPGRAARSARPARPPRPARPAKPARPATPAGGWSDMTFLGWRSQ